MWMDESNGVGVYMEEMKRSKEAWREKRLRVWGDEEEEEEGRKNLAEWRGTRLKKKKPR
jgi:hypothetical protein